MARNEIRLRREKMSSGRIAHHRNYGKLMARHKHDLKLKRLLRVFIITVYFLLVCLILIFIIFRNWETKQSKPAKNESAVIIKSPEVGKSGS